jgi:oligoendopeptidase F
VYSHAKGLLFLLGLALAAPLTAQKLPRADVPSQYRWNLADIYPSDADWKKAKQRFMDELPVFEGFRGTIGTSADRLLACLDLRTRLNKDFARMFTYVNLSLDQDLRVQSCLAMQQELDQAGAIFDEKTAFIDPEILKIGSPTIQSFLAGQKGLGIYHQFLTELYRGQAHIGTAGEEKIMALAGMLADAPSNIQNVFTQADFPYPEITLGNGETAKLDQAGFQRLRASSNRDDRRKAFAAYFGRFNDYRRTCGALLNAQIQKDLFIAKARNYGSCLQSSLDTDNIPAAVYTGLIDSVNKNLGSFHRYLKLRKRILGVTELHSYDLSAPLLGGVEMEYPIEEAKQHLLAAFQPLGEVYAEAVKKAFDQRWIDVYPNDGKRSGGYANGWAYDVHPYILFNYHGRYDDMSGMAHELGHAMHGYLSNAHQPFPTAAPPRFIVEVASTFNEALLFDQLLKHISDDKARLSLLGGFLENIAVTVFRAAQVSEFELRIHEMVEKGEQLTGDALNALYLEMARKYHGHDQRICVVDDETESGWMFIPQLYSSFYAYQYAASYTAAAGLSELVLSGDKAAVDRYIRFLSSGGSDYAINLLKKAGVDMTASKPFEVAMKKMNQAMDEVERILDKMKVRIPAKMISNRLRSGSFAQ